MGEVVPARTSPTLHPLPLCCNYPAEKCPSASIVMTSTLRFKLNYSQVWQLTEPTYVVVDSVLVLAIVLQANLRQSYVGSISVMAQCIETQLMPNESSLKDLQIMSIITPSWCNLRHKESTRARVFLLYSHSINFQVSDLIFLLSCCHCLLCRFSWAWPEVVPTDRGWLGTDHWWR